MYLSTILSTTLLLPIALAGVVPPPPPPLLGPPIINDTLIDGADANNTIVARSSKAPPPETSILSGNPSWCKYKYDAFDNWVAVYSRDWGYDDNMEGFADNLHGDCWFRLYDWSVYRHGHGKKGAYVTFSLPWLFVPDGKTKDCVASAFKKASPPHKKQSIECCRIDDPACSKRDAKRYFDREKKEKDRLE